MTQTIITAGDASAGLIQSAGNDGTLVLQTGAAGSKVNALSFAADLTPTLLKVPAVTAVQSMVRLNTANGYGSTNTRIRRFSVVVTNQGSDILYADSATLGASFTVNTSGVYAIGYTENFTTSDQLGISLNTTQPTVNISGITDADRLAYVYTPSLANTCGYVGSTLYLPAGSVIRPHTAAGAAGANNTVQFTITRVA